MRAVRILASLALAALVLAVAAWAVSRSPSFQFYGGLVHRVETGDSVVALTFDDGPTPDGTREILAILDTLDVRASFFLTGREMRENPGLARRIVEAGHELGNHSYSHERMYFASEARLRGEIETTDSLIRREGFTGPIFFRPPYGKKLLDLPRYLDRTGRTTVTWDVDPESGGAATAPELVAATLEKARPGSIILLHVMYGSREQSRLAVPGIVRGLRARGFRFVTLSELLREERPSP